MPEPGEYNVAGLAINDSIGRLCRRWGTEAVLGYLKDWVAYMEKQIATMERHGMRHNDGGEGG